MVLSKRKKWIYYYIFLFMCYTISVFYHKLECGKIASVCFVFIFLYLIVKGMLVKSRMDILVLLYMLYLALSYTWFLNNGMSSVVFATTFSYSVMPMCFYFLHNDRYQDKRGQENGTLFFKNFIIAIYFCLIAGWILYLWAPPVYGEFLVSRGLTSKARIGWIRAGFQSFCGVTCVSTFASIGTVYAYIKLKTSEFKDKKWIIWFFLGIVTIGISGRRSVYIALIFVLGFLIIYFKMRERKRLTKRILIITLMIVLAFLIFAAVFPKSASYIMQRISQMGMAIGERSGNWSEGLQRVSNIWIGDGLGSRSHTAATYSMFSVNDSAYMWILCEQGLVGIACFLWIVVSALLKGILNIKNRYFEIIVVLIFLIQGIGTNVFEFQLLAPVFWFSLGQCVKKEKINYVEDKFDEGISNVSSTVSSNQGK